MRLQVAGLAAPFKELLAQSLCKNKGICPISRARWGYVDFWCTFKNTEAIHFFEFKTEEKADYTEPAFQIISPVLQWYQNRFKRILRTAKVIGGPTCT